MTTFLGLEEEPTEEGTSLHLDTYIKELVVDYQNIHKKFIKPKSVPMSLGPVLNKENCPEPPLARYKGALVLWCSKMQKTVSLSSAAEEYSASEMAIEIIYLCNLLGNMGMPQGDNTVVFEDKI